MKDVSHLLGTQLTVDDPEKYEGGPVGLQVVARRFEEEKLLEMLEIIAQTIGEAV